MNGGGPSSIDAEASLYERWYSGADRGRALGFADPIEQHEFDVFVIGGDDEQVVARFISECSANCLNVSNRYALKFKQVNLNSS